MREIKFRAWDTHSADKMYSWEEIKNTFHEHVSHPFIEVMQFTGLKDKNGKECYEGDLSVINGNLCAVEFDTFYVCGWTFDIVDKPGCYSFSDTCTNFNNTGCQDFEIIGNIYQSPDLLSQGINKLS